MNHQKTLRELQRITNKYLSAGIEPAHAATLIEDLLEQDWVKKMLVFSNQALMITDLMRTKYLYISPSMEAVTGYPADAFPDVQTLMQKLMSSEEQALVPKQLEIALQAIADFNAPVSELHKFRYSRNNWIRHKNGHLINSLQHSMGLAFDERGMVQVELLMLIDITQFNHSPHHFYKITKMEDDGSETVITHGTLEQEAATLRELEVFGLLARGATSEEIAHRLHISAETVKVHRKNLLEKTKSENSIDLLRYGYANGWL